jgi:quinol monooxygenase YgiN
MTEPIVFISHFRVKDGKLDGFRRAFQDMTTRLQADMPRTLLYVAYADESGTQATILHVFPDADAMDLHFKGAAERSRVAYEFIEPSGWEIYGPAGASAIEMMRGEAATSGVTLTVQPAQIGGFLRLEPAPGWTR